MNITINQIPFEYNGKECFVHARACAVDENNIIMTMQKLNVYGDDLFSPLYVLKSTDGGKTWTEPVHDSAFTTEIDEDNVRTLGCDGTHLLHSATNTPIVLGHTVSYKADELRPLPGFRADTWYAVYDMQKGQYRTMKIIDTPCDIYPDGCATGCSQLLEADNGDLLVPVYIPHGQYYYCAVMRCSFDGIDVRFKEMSNELSFNIDRGLCEPSLTFYNGKYYLTLRNDRYGLYSVSDDCKTFSEPEIWRWDTDDILPTYNTQSHWLKCGGKLYLVYTRKAGNNDHVFRNRAPLFMAEVDTDTMRILRHTEKIVVPERGARLGNFGVTQIDDNCALITVTEWMQPVECEKYGSDNSLWLTKVCWED